MKCIHWGCNRVTQLVLVTMLLAYTAQAQTTIIKGVVLDNKSKPVEGANVSLLDSYDGATADSLGHFKFNTNDTGKKVIVVSSSGFKPISDSIYINGTPIERQFILKESINELQAVTVTAGVLDQKKISVLNAIDMVTVAGSNGDIAGALKTLPGTQQASDREGLFVRGGTGSETQQFIDGLLVRNAFLTGLPDLGSRGRFSPFLFKGTVFSSGGYSALYGQALSATINLESIDLPERTSASLNLSSVGIGAGYQHLNNKKTASFGGSYNWTNLSPYFLLVKQNIDYFKAPDYHNFDANFRVKTSEKGMLKFYMYGSLGNVGIRRPNIDSYEWPTNSYRLKNQLTLQNKNIYTNLSYKQTLANRWKFYTGLSYSANADHFNNEIVYQNNALVRDSAATPLDATLASYNDAAVNNTNSLAQGRIQFEKRFGNANAVRFGTEGMWYDDATQFNDLPQRSIKDFYKSLFAETDLYVTNNLGGKIGVRAEQSSGVLASESGWDRWRLSPRLSLAYRAGTFGEFSAAAGLFYQKPEARYLMINPNLDYMQATHYILNFTKSTKDRLLRIEAFYKKYEKLIKTASSTALFNPNFVQPYSANNNGSGYARGVELYFRDRRSLKGFDYWISYAYLDTKRDFLYYPIATQPDFVANNNASIVLKKFWTKQLFGINVTYSFATGRPYFNPNRYYANGQVHESEFLKDRTIPFNSVSLSANYIKKIKNTFTVFVLSVSNVLNFKQVYGYNYSAFATNADGTLYRQAIKPPAPMFIFLGVFMSFGIDRSQEAIDNNL